MLRTLLATTLGLGALTLAAPASAQGICGVRGDFVDHLAQRHREAPAAMGLASNGKMVEVLTNTETGTWTIIVTNADGSACVIAAGEAWQQMLPQVAMKPAA